MKLGRRTKYLTFALLFSFLVGSVFLGCQQGKSKLSNQRGGQQKESSKKQQSKYFASEKISVKEKQGKVTFQVGIESWEGAQKVRLWLPYPVSNEYQDVTDVHIDGNFANNGIYTEGEFGNTILYAEWEKPDNKPEMSFSFKVKRKEIVRKDFPKKEESSIPPEAKAFLTASNLVPTSGDCQDLAKKETKGKNSALGKTEAIYDYLVEEYQRDDAIIGCGNGDAAKLVVSKKGKCVDIHSVFVSFTRSVGVPAKEIFGIRMPPENGDMTKAYHCRSEFYIPGYGWVPVDASDVLKLMFKENLVLNDEKVKEARSYYFGAQTETYIDFGTGRDLTLNPPQEGEKLNYFMYPYAEVDGKPLDYLSQQDLRYTVTFEGS